TLIARSKSPQLGCLGGRWPVCAGSVPRAGNLRHLDPEAHVYPRRSEVPPGPGLIEPDSTDSRGDRRDRWPFGEPAHVPRLTPEPHWAGGPTTLGGHGVAGTDVARVRR